jgi:enterochelin esterase-like enzyme
MSMLHAVMALRVDKPPFLIAATVLAGVGLLVLLVRRYSIRSAAVAIAVGVLGTVVGAVLGWLTSDVWQVFGLPLTAVTRAWIACGVGSLAVATWSLATRPWWRRTVAVVCIPLFLLTSAAWINVDFGAYRDLTDALGIDPYSALALHHQSRAQASQDPHLGSDWAAPRGLPRHGEIGHVEIPATLSHFAARPAIVYLPPAALVAHPPTLPVIEMFSGQPGSPADMMSTAGVGRYLDLYAERHKGLAPIVVVPDQLSRPEHNPMCVDSPLGDSATYLTRDVPDWIRSHLNVGTTRNSWVVAGYSQGGTCSMQFGAGDTQLFGSIVDISGEVAPTIGTGTLARGFGGSEAAYQDASPLHLLKVHAPYDTWAVFGYGTADSKFGPGLLRTAAAAKAAGMTATVIPAQGSGHDWNTVRAVLSRALPLLCDHLGLGTK